MFQKLIAKLKKALTFDHEYSDVFIRQEDRLIQYINMAFEGEYVPSTFNKAEIFKILIKKAQTEILIFRQSNKYNVLDIMQWYEQSGENNCNSFNKRILDIRSFTSFVSNFSESESLDKNFDVLRQSNGLYLLDAKDKICYTTECNLSFPHDGSILNFPVAKASHRGIKWDIYCYNNVFYFARSWSGALVFRAYVDFVDKEIRIYKIDIIVEEFENDTELAINYVFYLLHSHAMQKTIPHPIPSYIPDDMKLFIALYSFCEFGVLAQYATKESILDLTVR